MRARLVIRVDAGHARGLAHAARTSRLLAAAPHLEAAALVGRGAALAAFFPGLEAIDPGADAGLACLEAAEATGARGVLCDEPEPDPALWRALDRRPDLVRLAIDDFGATIAADLVINGTVIEAYHAYPALRPGGVALCGAAHALIAPEFAAARARGPARDGPVLAVAGGGDRAADWARLLAKHGPALTGGRPMRLVVGQAFPDLADLRARAAPDVSVAQGLTAAELAAAMTAAPACVTTGGMIAYEAMAAGAPLLAFPQLDNLVAEIAWFAARGALVDLGFHTGDDPAALTEALCGVLNAPEHAAALGQAGAALVDGRGIERAAAAMTARLAGG